MGPIQLRGRSMYRLMKVISGLSFMMYGYDAGVLGGLIKHEPFLEAMGNPQGAYTIPIIVASYDAAASVTAMGITLFTFFIGRRGTILLGCGMSIIGALLQSSAYGIPQMIVGRVFTGFAIGCISSAVPTYLNECGSKATDRGPANAINAMFLIGGVPLAYWIDYGFVHWYAQASWRIPIILQCIFAFISGGTMWFLPDTPRWYYARKRNDEGDHVLSVLYDEPIDSKAVQETRKHVIDALEAENAASEKLHWTMFLTGGIVDSTRMKIVRRICMCFWIPMIGEWMGISFFSYFATIVLSRIVSADLVPVLAGVLTTVEWLGTIPLYWFIESLGRRSVMLYTACLSTAIFIPFIIMQALSTATTNWVAVGLLFAILPVQTFGWQAIKFLYSSEIAPLEYRHIGTGAAASGEWLMVFITVFVGPIGLEKCGWSFWFFFFAGNVVAIAFVFLLCPETAGKTLEQVDYLFMDRELAGLRKNFGIRETDAEQGVQQAHKNSVETLNEGTSTEHREKEDL